VRRHAGALGVRTLAAAGFVLCAILCLAQVAHAQTSTDFRRFVDGLWPEAQAMGVSRAVFDDAFRGVVPDLTLPDLALPGHSLDVKGQAEFTKTPAEYLNVSYLKRLAEQARAFEGKHKAALAKIERDLGVQRQFVLAIWGRETAFGTHRETRYAIQALATQAYAGRRKDMFRNELLHALKMLQSGVITREAMKSSWAGAMGLTQFMPSEYDTLAYDLDGDGRKDIWTSVPDALASAANQLRGKGWVVGQPGGYEVRLPKGTSCLAEGPQHAQPVRAWARLGVVRTRARAFDPAVLDANAFILTPAGAHGPAFLALENFLVIKRYNMSDLYALFVGDLGDRIAGDGGFETPWGSVRQLSATGIGAIQERLQKLGYPIEKIDGKAGMNTRALIGAYQKASGMNVDCWPSEAVLAHARSAAARRAGPQLTSGESVTRDAAGGR
jgi:lytic murein transglycosylase